MKPLLWLPIEFLKQLWMFLTEPFESLPRSEDRRRAIMSTAVSLFSFLAVGGEQLTTGKTPAIMLVLLFTGYIFSRTRWYKAAVLVLLAALSFPSFQIALTVPNPDSNRILTLFVWIILPLIFCSLIYSTRTTFIYSVINLLLLIALIFIRDGMEFSVIRATLGFYGLTSLFIITVMVQRDEIEKDRQSELIESRNTLSREAAHRERFAEQAHRRADQMAMLNEVSVAISNLKDLDNIFTLILEQVKQHFQLDVFFIALYNEKTGRLSFPLMFDDGKLWNEPEKELSKAVKVAQVLQTGEPLLWNRSEDEIKAATTSDNRLGDSSRVAASILITPLQVGGKAIGVISVQSYTADAYGDEQRLLLSALAHQIVIAIENARLFDETVNRTQRLAILNEIGREISTISDLPSLMENVYQQVRKALSVDLFFIGLYNKAKHELTFPIMYDAERKWEQPPSPVLENTFSGKTILTRKPLLVNHWSGTANESESTLIIVGDDSRTTQALMFTPMLSGDETIGVLSVQSYDPNAYTEEDLNLLSGIANQVGIAIQNSRLYTSAQQEIAERQKAEEQLRSAEAKYRELVERVPAVIYSSETGATGRWFYVSPQIEALLGFTPEEWMAHPDLWYQQIHPDDREYAVTTEAKLLAEGSRLETEYRIYTKDRHLLWIHDESLNVSVSDDQQHLVQGFLMDITMRKQAELTLKESEEKYHSLFITADRQARELTLFSEVQNAIARELDLPVLIHTVVEAIAKTFGYTFVSLYKLENGFLHLQHQVGYERVIEKISPSAGVSGRVMSTGQPILIKDVTLEPDFLRASQHIQSEVCVPLFNGDEIFGVLNVESSLEYQLTEDDLRLMHALSEQVNIAIRRARLYADRAESLRREQHINEFAHAISSTLDLAGVLEIVVRLSTEMIGADAGTVSLMSDDGKTMANVYSFNDDPDLNPIIPTGQGLTWLTYEKGRPIILNEYSQHPNALPEWASSHLHAFMSVPITIGEKRLGALTLYNRTSDKKFTQRDVSLIEALAQEVAISIQNARLFVALQKELAEHKQTQDQLQIIVRELEAKNAELERFTYSVSHDLKSPLVTIGGFLGFLEADIKKGEMQRIENTINRIREAAKKMHRLLDEVLELSRIGRLINPPAEVSFGELVSEALELAHGQLTEKQIQVKVDAEFPVVQVDRVRMVEVLQNLIVNATKFTRQNEKPIIEIGTQIVHGQQTFFVKDNGIGIAPEYHQKVFGLFDKLDAKSEGTGIGLALVKRIIEVHGGTIWVESEIGKGATFFFTLKPKKQQEKNL